MSHIGESTTNPPHSLQIPSDESNNQSVSTVHDNQRESAELNRREQKDYQNPRQTPMTLPRMLSNPPLPRYRPFLPHRVTTSSFLPGTDLKYYVSPLGFILASTLYEYDPHKNTLKRPQIYVLSAQMIIRPDLAASIGTSSHGTGSSGGQIKHDGQRGPEVGVPPSQPEHTKQSKGPDANNAKTSNKMSTKDQWKSFFGFSTPKSTTQSKLTGNQSSSAAATPGTATPGSVSNKAIYPHKDQERPHEDAKFQYQRGDHRDQPQHVTPGTPHGSRAREGRHSEDGNDKSLHAQPLRTHTTLTATEFLDSHTEGPQPLGLTLHQSHDSDDDENGNEDDKSHNINSNAGNASHTSTTTPQHHSKSKQTKDDDQEDDVSTTRLSSQSAVSANQQPSSPQSSLFPHKWSSHRASNSTPPLSPQSTALEYDNKHTPSRHEPEPLPDLPPILLTLTASDATDGASDQGDEHEDSSPSPSHFAHGRHIPYDDDNDNGGDDEHSLHHPLETAQTHEYKGTYPQPNRVYIPSVTLRIYSTFPLHASDWANPVNTIPINPPAFMFRHYGPKDDHLAVGNATSGGVSYSSGTPRNATTSTPSGKPPQHFPKNSVKNDGSPEGQTASQGLVGKQEKQGDTPQDSEGTAHQQGAHRGSALESDLSTFTLSTDQQQSSIERIESHNELDDQQRDSHIESNKKDVAGDDIAQSEHEQHPVYQTTLSLIWQQQQQQQQTQPQPGTALGSSSATKTPGRAVTHGTPLQTGMAVPPLGADGTGASAGAGTPLLSGSKPAHKTTTPWVFELPCSVSKDERFYQDLLKRKEQTSHPQQQQQQQQTSGSIDGVDTAGQRQAAAVPPLPPGTRLRKASNSDQLPPPPPLTTSSANDPWTSTTRHDTSIPPSSASSSIAHAGSKNIFSSLQNINNIFKSSSKQGGFKPTGGGCLAHHRQEVCIIWVHSLLWLCESVTQHLSDYNLAARTVRDQKNAEQTSRQQSATSDDVESTNNNVTDIFPKPINFLDYPVPFASQLILSNTMAEYYDTIYPSFYHLVPKQDDRVHADDHPPSSLSSSPLRWSQEEEMRALSQLDTLITPLPYNMVEPLERLITLQTRTQLEREKQQQFLQKRLAGSGRDHDNSTNGASTPSVTAASHPASIASTASGTSQSDAHQGSNGGGSTSSSFWGGFKSVLKSATGLSSSSSSSATPHSSGSTATGVALGDGGSSLQPGESNQAAGQTSSSAATTAGGGGSSQPTAGLLVHTILVKSYPRHLPPPPRLPIKSYLNVKPLHYPMPATEIKDLPTHVLPGLSLKDLFYVALNNNAPLSWAAYHASASQSKHTWNVRIGEWSASNINMIDRRFIAPWAHDGDVPLPSYPPCPDVDQSTGKKGGSYQPMAFAPFTTAAGVVLPPVNLALPQSSVLSGGTTSSGGPVTSIDCTQQMEVSNPHSPLSGGDNNSNISQNNPIHSVYTAVLPPGQSPSSLGLPSLEEVYSRYVQTTSGGKHPSVEWKHYVTRTMSMDIQILDAPGKPKTRLLKTQRLGGILAYNTTTQQIELAGMVFESANMTPDVTFGDSFVVCEQWIILPTRLIPATSSPSTSTSPYYTQKGITIIPKVAVHFLKTGFLMTPFLPMIHSRSVGDTARINGEFVTFIQSQSSILNQQEHIDIISHYCPAPFLISPCISHQLLLQGVEKALSSTGDTILLGDSSDNANNSALHGLTGGDGAATSQGGTEDDDNDELTSQPPQDSLLDTIHTTVNQGIDSLSDGVISLATVTSPQDVAKLALYMLMFILLFSFISKDSTMAMSIVLIVMLTSLSLQIVDIRNHQQSTKE